MLKLSAIHKSFGPTLAVSGLTLEIEPRRTTVLIGPSGCGKSTLLRLMNGLVTPDAGTVEFEGEALTPSRAPELRRRIAQELGALPSMAFTHTCYNGRRPPCGECPACRLRAKGFLEAGIADPLDSI